MSYNAATNTVTVIFAPSPSANVISYTLRQSLTTPYDAENENDIATKPAAAPYEFVFVLTTVAAGSSGVFKVYTENESGGMKGSRAFKVRTV